MAARAVASICEAQVSVVDELRIREFQVRQCSSDCLERILLSALKHQCEAEMLEQLPAITEYLSKDFNPKTLSGSWCETNSSLLQLHACYQQFIHPAITPTSTPSPSSATESRSQRGPSNSALLLLLLGLYQSAEGELRDLAVCRVLSLLHDFCLCSVVDTMFHFLASTASRTTTPNHEGVAKAADVIFFVVFRSTPMRTLEEGAMSALQTMIESAHFERDQPYEEIRTVLNVVWQFGEELGDSSSAHPKCNNCIPTDCRVLFLLYAFLITAFGADSEPGVTSTIKSSLCSKVLTNALFPSDEPLKHTSEDIARVLLLFSEFLEPETATELHDALATHCPQLIELILPPTEASLKGAEDAIAEAELERRKDLRLKNSLYEPVITDEEVTRVTEIQKFLTSNRVGGTKGVPKKGYLLAAYRQALADTRDWKRAVEQVQENPERFRSIMTGAFKNLPLYTTPEKLMQIMVDRKMQRSSATTPNQPLPSGGLQLNDKTLDPNSRGGVKSSTLRLARQQEGLNIDDSAALAWGTQEEVETLMKAQAEERELKEGIERARAENRIRQELKRMPPKQRRAAEQAAKVPLMAAAPTTVTVLEAATPTADAKTDETRGWGPDKIKGGRIPKPKAAAGVVNKKTKTFDKHHARDRRLEKL